MTLHAIIEYLNYRWRAKNRHGVHSPFVYHLNDVVLRDRSKKTLIEKVYAHYGGSFLVKELPIGEEPAEMQDSTLVIVKGIHQNPVADAAWEALKSNPKIPLTIDLFEVGLLINDPAFKEKQHFALRT